MKLIIYYDVKIEYRFNESLEKIALIATCIQIGIGVHVEPVTNPTEYVVFRAFYL